MKIFACRLSNTKDVALLSGGNLSASIQPRVAAIQLRGRAETALKVLPLLSETLSLLSHVI